MEEKEVRQVPKKILMIDLQLIPEGWEVKRWLEIIKETGVAFYDGNNLKDKRNLLKVIDLDMPEDFKSTEAKEIKDINDGQQREEN